MFKWKKVMIHLVATRLNMRIKVYGDPDEEYFHYRCDLFEKTCLKSILSQECRDFTWLIFTSDVLPASIEARMKAYEPYASLIRVPAQQSTLPLSQIKKEIENRRKDEEIVITTNIDSDDILHKTYTKLLHEISEYEQEVHVGPIIQYWWSLQGSVIQKHRYPSMFSIIETSKNIRSCFAKHHTQISEIFPKHVYIQAPSVMVTHYGNAWIHGGRTRGKTDRVEFKEYGVCESDIVDFLSNKRTFSCMDARTRLKNEKERLL